MTKSIVPDYPAWPRQLDPAQYLDPSDQHFIDHYLCTNNASEALRRTHPTATDHMSTKQIGRRATRTRKRLADHIATRRTQLQNYYNAVSTDTVKRDLLDLRDRLLRAIEAAPSQAQEAKLYTELNKVLRALGESQGLFITKHESTHTIQHDNRKEIEERLEKLRERSAKVIPLREVK